MKSFSPLRLIIGLLAVFMLIPSYAANTGDTTKTYSDASKSILVSKSTPEFTIELASNPTTGYSWHLLNYDHDLVRLVKHVFVAPTSNMVGAGGKELWKFQVNENGFIAPQIGKIVLLYARPWNLTENSKQVEFTVVTG